MAQLTASFSRNALSAVVGGILVAHSTDSVPLTVTGVVSQFIISLHTEDGAIHTIEIGCTSCSEAQFNLAN